MSATGKSGPADDDAEEIVAAYLLYATWAAHTGHRSDVGSFDRAQLEEQVAEVLLKMSESIADDPPPSEEASSREGATLAELLQNLAGDAPPGQWAADRVDDELKHGQAAWGLLQRIIRGAPDDDAVLGYIGVHLFEHWLTDEVIVALCPSLNIELRESSKLRRALRACWDLPPSLARMLAIADKDHD